MFINDIEKGMRNPFYLLADFVKTAGVDLLEFIEAFIAWSDNWDVSLNLTQCQRLAPGTK